VNRKRSNAGDLRRLQRAQHGVLEQAAAEALALPGGCHGKPRQQHDGHGMMRQTLGQPFRRLGVLHLTHHQRVVAGDLFLRQGDVGLRRSGPLVLKRVPYQEAVERFPAAIERVDGVVAPQLFDA